MTDSSVNERKGMSRMMFRRGLALLIVIQATAVLVGALIAQQYFGPGGIFSSVAAGLVCLFCMGGGLLTAYLSPEAEKSIRGLLLSMFFRTLVPLFFLVGYGSGVGYLATHGFGWLLVVNYLVGLTVVTAIHWWALQQTLSPTFATSRSSGAAANEAANIVNSASETAQPSG